MMELFLLSEQFYARPSDTEYMVSLVAAENEQAALDIVRWSVRGPNTNFIQNWDVYRLGGVFPTHPGIPVVTVNDRVGYEIAAYGEAIAPLQDRVFRYRETTLHQIRSGEALFYVEDLTAITNYAYRAPPQLPDENNDSIYVEATDMPMEYKPTGICRSRCGKTLRGNRELWTAW